MATAGRRPLELIAVGLPRLLLGALCFAGIAINFANVVGRYVFSAPIIWAEEVLVYMMIWCVFIGAILVTWEGRHIKMDLLSTHLPPPWRQIVNGLQVLVLVLVCGFVVVQSWTITSMMAELDQRSVVARMPMSLVHGAILTGFVLMLLAGVLRARAHVRGETGSEAEATAEQLKELYGDFAEDATAPAGVRSGADATRAAEARPR